jgi:hypothetical protein
MNLPPARMLRQSARLCGRLCLGLLVLAGLSLILGVSVRPAHAQSTLRVTNCTSDAQLQAEVAQANRDNAGDVISFACSGDLKLTSTLTITGNMTLSGSGQHVTLDGGDSRQVLFVSGNGNVSLTLDALTVAHGSASSASIPSGGGLLNQGTVSISNSTFANNSANGGGGLYNKNSTLNISGSIVAENTGGNCTKFGGTFTDNGYNLDSDNSCFSAATSKHGNPQLSPLANHGGPTQTLALLKGSPAIDDIPLASALCPATDQRGHKRPDNPHESACDIGAFES